MPYIIECWDERRKKYMELDGTLRPTKNDLEAEVEDLNKLVPKEQARLMAVTHKYRVKKVKNPKPNTELIEEQ